LVRCLPFLAAFSIASGLAQWEPMFIPIQAGYLSPQQISALEFVRVSLLA